MKKFSIKDMGTDKLFIILLAGVILLILSFPTSNSKKPKEAVLPTAEGTSEEGADYEKLLEKRLEEILKTVDGVGKVEVMITLKSSEEKIVQLDKTTKGSTTEETDSGGGLRKVVDQEATEKTVLVDNSTGNEPFVQKELKPEIAGIVVSAAGGGSAAIKSEIIGAIEALFDVPPHKIKVLKRVE